MQKLHDRLVLERRLLCLALALEEEALQSEFRESLRTNGC